ncbi:calcium/sodium antiporter [Flavobacteriales bacterium]|jgi:cation:H+ antiporter|nr:calcium/sodium antiporter [Flavobacteriales bacterium]
MGIDVFWLVLGLAVLIFSGDYLVKGAVGIAEKFKISPLVIGMTVVSFGTSAPELFVSIRAALDGSPDLAIGNVIGSNIANIALVLSITVLIFPILVDRNSKIIDWPMMMFSSILFYVFSLDGVISSLEGLVLFVLLIIFTVLLIRNSRKLNLDLDEDVDGEPTNMPLTLFFLIGGLIGLKFGADWFVDGAKGVAKGFGMSDKVIGVTIVAFGTSVPELVASGVAAFRHQTDISLGNLVGSNIFNIMIVIGITAMIMPIKVADSVMSFDMYWMLGISLALYPMMFIGKKMGRIHGIILLTAYITFIVLCLTSI